MSQTTSDLRNNDHNIDSNHDNNIDNNNINYNNSKRISDNAATIDIDV